MALFLQGADSSSDSTIFAVSFPSSRLSMFESCESESGTGFNASN